MKKKTVHFKRYQKSRNSLLKNKDSGLQFSERFLLAPFYNVEVTDLPTKKFQVVRARPAGHPGFISNTFRMKQ